VIGRVVRVEQLHAEQRMAMFRLLTSHFDGVQTDQFQKDLEEKDYSLLVEDTGGRLLGFSTFAIYAAPEVGEGTGVLCSGDTIVERSAWGSSAWLRTWIRSVLELRERLEVRRLFWLLLVSGFRTYRFLPVFFREFHPRHDAPTPSDTARLIGHLARARFGERYDGERGIVRFEHPQRLHSELARISEGRRRNPHVACFEQLNPHHARGDELVCATWLDPTNLTAAGLRVLGGDTA